MKAVFRVDASATIGGGHVMRCLTLAKALRMKGVECLFLSSPETASTVHALSESGFALQTPEEAGIIKTEVLIIDHYKLGQQYAKKYRSKTDCILVIDDLANRPHIADVLLDQTFGRTPDEYAKLTPENCRVLTGSDYALLRPAFAENREKSLARRQAMARPKRILVAYGLSDQRKLVEITCDAILDVAQKMSISFEIDVVLRAHWELNSLENRLARTDSRITIRQNLSGHEMAALMADADLSFGSPGTSSWERCCLGLPSILVTTASNQDRIAEELNKAGAAKALGALETISPDRLVKALKTFVNSVEQQKHMSAHASAICDGLGVERVAEEVLSIAQRTRVQ